MSRFASPILALVLGLGCNFQCDVHPGEPPVVDLELHDPAPPGQAHLRQPTPAPVAPSAESSDRSRARVAPARATDPPPPAPEVPETPLELQIDGEPLEWRSAWVTSRGGRALFLVFSTRAEPGCPANLRAGDRGETRVHVSVYPALPSDGSGWRVGRASAFLSPSGLRSARPAEPGAAAIDEEPSEIGDRVSGGVDLRTPEIVASGRFEATYCGAERRLPEPADYPTIRVEVGGERVPIRGARYLLQDDMVRLVLTSAGSRCGQMLGSDIEVEVRHYGLGPTPRQREVYVSGHRLSGDRAWSYAGTMHERITFVHDPVLTPGTHVLADVSFEGETSGFPVLVRGHVSAIVCPRL